MNGNFAFKGETSYSRIGIVISIIGSAFWLLIGLRIIVLELLELQNGINQNRRYDISFTQLFQGNNFLTNFSALLLILLVLVLLSIWVTSKEFENRSEFLRQSIFWILGTVVSCILLVLLGSISTIIEGMIFSLIYTVLSDYSNIFYAFLVIAFGLIIIRLWSNPSPEIYKKEKRFSIDDEAKWGMGFVVLGIIGGSFASLFVILGGLMLLSDVISTIILFASVASQS